MNAFSVQELVRPGLLRRLTGGKAPENAFIEIQNALAAKPLATLAAADVINILSSYEIPRDSAMPHLLSLYKQAFEYFLQDTVLSDSDRADLKQLKYVLDIDDQGAADVEASHLQAIYRHTLKMAVSDGQLSDEEKANLNAMVQNFSLPEQIRTSIYKEETRAVIQEAFNEAIRDRRLTTAEEARLVAMAKSFGVTFTHDADTQRLVERFKLLARIDAGELPILTVPLSLQRGEVCHAQFACRLHELRTVTKRINYSGPTGRIRIMKGLSWRYGSVSVRRVTSEQMQQIDSGVLYVTNKRLLFNGSLKNANIPFKKIIHFTHYSDGLQIEKDTGRDQYFLGSGDLELVSNVLEVAMRKA